MSTLYNLIIVADTQGYRHALILEISMELASGSPV